MDTGFGAQVSISGPKRCKPPRMGRFRVCDGRVGVSGEGGCLSLRILEFLSLRRIPVYYELYLPDASL